MLGICVTLALVAMGAAAFCFVIPSSGINKENILKIRHGMTVDEIEDLLGCPGSPLNSNFRSEIDSPAVWTNGPGEDSVCVFF